MHNTRFFFFFFFCRLLWRTWILFLMTLFSCLFLSHFSFLKLLPHFFFCHHVPSALTHVLGLVVVVGGGGGGGSGSGNGDGGYVEYSCHYYSSTCPDNHPGSLHSRVPVHLYRLMGSATGWSR